ncbi:transcription factor HES-2 isoform X2 [Alligator mississippiensis]|uniref:transcription factor HES-2 isoform X2 n=1 Tax=Alligator mississippiensis TaxID=8496 RepID=UPI002877B17D|nr:transcription factor HES-2 isoform X2 [Alligator mississippiensis]
MSPHSAAPCRPQPGAHCRAGDAAEQRKTLKPLMEKRRRARINESLNQLKTLILPLVGKDSSRYSKLEKADILEMTVRFLQELPAPGSDPAEGYREGYRACLARLAGLLAKGRLLDRDAGRRLLEHLQRASAEPARRPRRGPAGWQPGLPRAVPLGPAGGGAGRAGPCSPAAGAGLWRPW